MRSALIKTAKYMAVLLMAMLILPGVLWGGKALTALQPYREYEHILALAGNLCSDDYTGILYPALVALAALLQRAASIPFSAFIYVLQIAAFLAACGFLLGEVFPRQSRKERLFLMLFLACVPYLMQMHLAVLPRSLTLSAFLVLLGSFAGIINLRWEQPQIPDEQGRVAEKSGRPEERKTLRGYLLCAAASQLALCLLLIENLWIGLFLWAVFLLVFLLGGSSPAERQCSRKKAALLLAATAVIASLAGFALNRITYVPDDTRIQNSFGAAMVSRFVWPNFATNYFFWSDEVKAVMSEEDSVYICEREEAVEDYFGPKMDAAYGRRAADRMYLQMAAECLKDRSRETVTAILVDFADYALIPLTIGRNLQGSGTSLTAYHYHNMETISPQAVKYYYRLGYTVLAALLVLRGILFVCVCKERKRGDRAGQDPAAEQNPAAEKNTAAGEKTAAERQIGLLILGTCAVFVLWYTFSSNRPVDYTNVLPLLFFWFLWGAGTDFDLL